MNLFSTAAMIVGTRNGVGIVRRGPEKQNHNIRSSHCKNNWLLFAKVISNCDYKNWWYSPSLGNNVRATHTKGKGVDWYMVMSQVMMPLLANVNSVFWNVVNVTSLVCSAKHVITQTNYNSKFIYSFVFLRKCSTFKIIIRSVVLCNTAYRKIMAQW